MHNRAVAWSSLVVAVVAPVAYSYATIQYGWWFAAGDSDRLDPWMRLMWLTFIAAEVVAVILSIVACSRRRNSPTAALPLPAILGAFVALVGLAFSGLLFRPGA
jgi:hypothetical protein